MSQTKTTPAHGNVTQAFEAITEKIGNALDNTETPIIAIYRMHVRFQNAQKHLSPQSQERLHQTLHAIKKDMHIYNATATPKTINAMRAILTAKNINQQALRHHYQKWRDGITDKIDASYETLEALILTMQDDERQAFLTELLKNPLPFMHAPSP